RDIVLTHGATLIWIVNTCVRIPELACCRRAQTLGVKRATLISAELPEISGALRRAGHTSIFRGGYALTVALIIKEEEGTVLSDRSAHGDTELVPAHRRNTGREEVLGVQLVVAQEIISAAMEIVRSRTRHDIDHR